VHGSTGGDFAALAFDSTGILYGVTNDNIDYSGEGLPPEALYVIDLAGATVTPFLTLGKGDFGEAIAYNPDDGMLYHSSGLDDPVFESINLTAKTTNAITLSGDLVEEQLAITYDTNGSFFMCGIVGYVGAKPAIPILLKGLSHLEYRGYDSAGVVCSSIWY